MYGYVYKTTNKITNEVYIGQKKSEYFVDDYFGSGVNIQRDLKEYGKCSFKVKPLKEVYSQEELDFYEIYYIEKYKKKYGDRCINIASGGMHGANTHKYASPESRKKFKDTMTAINRKRCQSEEFKKKCSERMIIRYSDPEERKRQSEITRKFCHTEEYRKKCSESHKQYWATHEKDGSMFYKPCVFKLNDIYIEFESVNALREYLITEYNYNPDRRTFKKLMNDGKNNIPYKPFHRNKMGKLSGMIIYYK